MIMADCPQGMARQIRNATFTLLDRGRLAMITGLQHLGHVALSLKPAPRPPRPAASPGGHMLRVTCGQTGQSGLRNAHNR